MTSATDVTVDGLEVVVRLKVAVVVVLWVVTATVEIVTSATVVMVVDGIIIVLLTALVVLGVVSGTVVELVVVDGLTVVVLAASVVFELDEKKPSTLSITPAFLVFVAFADDDLIPVLTSFLFVSFSTSKLSFGSS